MGATRTLLATRKGRNRKTARPGRFVVPVAAVLVVALSAAPALAVRIEDITRLKGDRENKLIGLGLVVGLPGTGDGDDFVPAIRSLHQLLWRLGYEARSARELEDSENVAVVSVSATLPPFAREGDKIDVKRVPSKAEVMVAVDADYRKAIKAGRGKRCVLVGRGLPRGRVKEIAAAVDGGEVEKLPKILADELNKK